MRKAYLRNKFSMNTKMNKNGTFVEFFQGKSWLQVIVRNSKSGEQGTIVVVGFTLLIISQTSLVCLYVC